RMYDFDVVPNGLLLDERGILRFRHIGGFDIRRPEIEAQLEALLRTDFAREAAPSLVRQEALELEVLLAEAAAAPEDAALQFALGQEYLRQGRVAEAEAALRRAVALDPLDWSAAFALGVTLHERGQTPEA